MTVEEAEAIAAELEGKSVNEILHWAIETFGDYLGFMTALGYSGVVLMDHLRKIKPQFEACFIDTGFHFPETLEFLQRLRDEWSINFKVLTPVMSKDGVSETVGTEPWKVNADLCCLYMKVEPMLRAIHTRQAWLSAIRRDQSVARASIDVVEIDGRGVLKIYPLAAWTSEQVWEYIRSHDIPYNPLHDTGYLSVGCTHCTAPVAPGEHERTGRWNSMPKLECGLHLHGPGRRRKKAKHPPGRAAGSE